MEKPELIAEAIFDLSKSIRLLGNGNIDRGDNAIGAIEGLVIQVKESNQQVAQALGDIAEAIRDLAQAVESNSEQKG